MPGAWSSSPEMALDLDLALPPLPPPRPLGTQMAAHLALEALHAERFVLSTLNSIKRPDDEFPRTKDFNTLAPL
jgi:hypothetical protein